MLLSEQELLEKFQAKSFSKLREKLEAQGVKFLHGTNGKVVTTLQAINRVLYNEQTDTIELYGEKKS